MERVFLVGIRRPRESRDDMEAALAELGLLVDTAGGTVVGQTTQEIKRISSATYIHYGKVLEIGEAIRAQRAETIVLDTELTAAQNRQLSEAWQVKVLDRSAVILDIFARRAQSQAGKLQVELAQLQYRLPRLMGRGQYHFMQQSGHMGNRGPGETRLEIDRRRTRERITRLQRELRLLRQHRALHRGRRAAVPIPTIALVGYTNAGKSTLMNALSAAGVFVEDRLFATLDPTVRRITLPSGRAVLLADTVGFIRRLPHPLVEAFRATFEEVAAADLLCHVVDASAPDAVHQQTIAEQVLAEMNLADLPRLTVWNKCDLLGELRPSPQAPLRISAQQGTGLAALLAACETQLDRHLCPIQLRLPQADAKYLDEIYRLGHVLRVAHHGDWIEIEARVPPSLQQRLLGYAR